MNKKEVIKVAAELLTHAWPSEFSSDWQFPKCISLKYRRKIIKEAEAMRDQMIAWSDRLRGALEAEEGCGMRSPSGSSDSSQTSGAERPRVTCRDSAKPRPAGQRRTRRMMKSKDNQS